ncbi:response regulator [Sulfuritalea hydrogenivorans]|jgi:two-component system nitrate/nitrite response regulator NarL|uniref:Two component LuxR family transcriptionalregulator n=1 Tax=Sulfuritalea hydrogenivorans sk43H TaxID=1223802 RepID=W0SHC7_9PROT|nr:response regulator [Sulfuritalea hydrogenivorans]MDK9713196.1 response regulator [Sulfuritalea sp.]BAO29193.1 two component LuxR family transcriptionalregulator [Sulfuritalea hydrogenivorans sk43H]
MNMEATDPIRVLLVDDHTLFRKGLAELLEQRGTITVAGIAGNGDDALRILAETRPDVIISDLNMPPNGGLSMLRQLVADGWTGPVLILTVSDAEEDLAAAMQAGAKGYLLKDMEPEDVVDAVQRAVRGETVVAPAMTLKLVNLLQGGNAASTKADTLKLLTAREREILQQLSQGLSNKAIARVLDISHDTVKLHVKHILAKLNLTSRVEAAVFAVEQKAAELGRRGS